MIRRKVIVDLDLTSVYRHPLEMDMLSSIGASDLYLNVQGSIIFYSLVSDTYQVAIRHLGVAFIQAGEISPADMRLLALLPKPMTANDIYDKFKVRS